jgi:hypothetical protein
MVEKCGHEVVGIIVEPGVGRFLNQLDIKREILQIPGIGRIGVLNAHYGALLKYRRVYARVRPEVGDTIWKPARPQDAPRQRRRGRRGQLLQHAASANTGNTGDESVGIGGELLAGVLGYLQRGTVRPRKQAADEVVQYFSMHPRIHAVAERKARRRVSQ